MKGIQYTIRGIPEELDTALREEAAAYGKSLNSLLMEKLASSCQLEEKEKTNGLEAFAGCMEEDSTFDEAMKEFERVDPEDWP